MTVFSAEVLLARCACFNLVLVPKEAHKVAFYSNHSLDKTESSITKLRYWSTSDREVGHPSSSVTNLCSSNRRQTSRNEKVRRFLQMGLGCSVVNECLDRLKNQAPGHEVKDEWSRGAECRC